MERSNHYVSHAAKTRSSDVLPFGRLWYGDPDDAIDYAKFFSRSHHAVICVYDDARAIASRTVIVDPALSRLLNFDLLISNSG